MTRPKSIQQLAKARTDARLRARRTIAIADAALGFALLSEARDILPTVAKGLRLVSAVELDSRDEDGRPDVNDSPNVDIRGDGGTLYGNTSNGSGVNAVRVRWWIEYREDSQTWQIWASATVKGRHTLRASTTSRDGEGATLREAAQALIEGAGSWRAGRGVIRTLRADLGRTA